MANMLKVAMLLASTLLVADAFSRNAVHLGLVSKTYPLQLWDTLAALDDSEISPQFRRFLDGLDRERAGNEHWCCHSGRTEPLKVPVYNNRGEVVAWNTVPCEKVGCCDKYLEVANHCLDKSGQSKLLDALDVARDRLGSQDVTDLIALLNKGGLIG